VETIKNKRAFGFASLPENSNYLMANFVTDTVINKEDLPIVACL